jgi:phosphoribosylanthranilate isomerase
MLNANPTSIQSGQSSTLSWATSNAASVTLDGAAVAANGSRVVSPTSTTTYSLVATNATGSVTSTVTVTVVAMPRLTYVNDIAPIMQSNCVQCHSGPQPTAGRDFTTYMGVMQVVTPFDPNSRLIQMTQPGAPMHGFLQPDPATRAEIIRKWVVDFGAPER